IATIANNYYTLLTLDEKLDISRRTLQNWEDNLRVLDVLKRAGRVNQTSVLQSKANKIALETSIVTIEEQIALLESSLSTLLATPSATIKRDSINDVNFPSEISVGVPMQLLSNRPDVRVAEYYLAQMFYATNEARSGLYPSITLSGSAGFTNNSSSIINPGEMLYSAIGSFVQPLFYRGTLRAQLKISEAQQEQALLAFQQSLLDAGNEVNAALISWQSAKRRIDHNNLQLEVLQKAVRTAELLMRSGEYSYLEVITAQLSLLQTELSATEDRFGEIQGVIDLYRALGGGEV
ncbi:MAG: TolC family protein, partial [Rikenellaceae bacterium]